MQKHDAFSVVIYISMKRTSHKKITSTNVSTLMSSCITVEFAKYFLYKSIILSVTHFVIRSFMYFYLGATFVDNHYFFSIKE